ncbi:hypothetical protein RsS62_46680 [Rhizobium dioscoreae]|nr:hypothetical protein FBZ99_101372 [Rhizobium sp. ERR1071]GES45416.1 hypothetical protein RsS62_46680 [Rhizobium dioscoreae]
MFFKNIIRGFFKKYGYTFIKTEYLVDEKDTEYASINIVTEDNLQKKILFIYLADEVSRTHILTKENIKDTIVSCQLILEELNNQSEGSNPLDR